MNRFVCKDCGTVYSTPRAQRPPTPKWADGHRCELIIPKNTLEIQIIQLKAEIIELEGLLLPDDCNTKYAGMQIRLKNLEKMQDA
jgi:hypothetical protein